MVIIHVDIVLITNFVFTALIIWFVGRLWNLKASTIRILLVAFLSTLYLIFILLLGNHSLPLYIIGHVGLSITMVKVCWKVEKWRMIGKYVLTMYGVAFLWGGLATAFWNLFYVYKSLVINILSLLFVLSLGIYSGKRVLGFLQKKQEEKGGYSLRIKLQGREQTVRAFLDTGHALKGLAGETVIIIAWSVIKVLLESIHLGCLFPTPNDLLLYLPPSEQEKIKIIPYSSIGVDWGTMLAISPQKVDLLVSGKDLAVENCLLALHEGKIHSEYEAILPAEMKNILERSYE